MASRKSEDKMSSNEQLEERNRAARRAAEVTRNKSPEQRRREKAERDAVRTQVLKRIIEGEVAARIAFGHERYVG